MATDRIQLIREAVERLKKAKPDKKPRPIIPLEKKEKALSVYTNQNGHYIDRNGRRREANS